MAEPARRRTDTGDGESAALEEALVRQEFTPREARILSLVRRGFTFPQIVRELRAGRRSDDPEPAAPPALSAMSPQLRAIAVVALAGLINAAIIGVNLLVGGEQQTTLFMLVIPIALLAIEFRLFGGLIGAAVAILALTVMAFVDPGDVGFAGFVVKAGAYVLTAVVVGSLAARMDRVTHPLHAPRARRAFDAVAGAAERASEAAVRVSSRRS